MATQQTALITGATSGIGRELANCFAQDKYNLVIVARDQQELDQTATETPAAIRRAGHDHRQRPV